MPWLAIGGSLLGGLIQSDSAGDAASSQAASSAASIAEQRRQYDLTRSDYAPYRSIGTNALRRLGALYGVGDGGGSSSGASGGLTEAQIRQMLAPQFTTTVQQQAQTQFPYSPREGPDNGILGELAPAQPTVNQQGLDAAVQERMSQQGQQGVAGGAQQTYNDGLDGPIELDPGYQFGLDQGNQALDRKIAAGGGRVSGAAIKAAQRFGTDYATTGYNAAYQRRQDRINRLSALAGIGQSATGASAQAGSAAANNISGALQSQGNASGAASLAQGNIWGNAINQAGAAWQRGRQNSGFIPTAGVGGLSAGGSPDGYW
jgi:hypothetical protein